MRSYEIDSLLSHTLFSYVSQHHHYRRASYLHCNTSSHQRGCFLYVCLLVFPSYSSSAYMFICNPTRSIHAVLIRSKLSDVSYFKLTVSVFLLPPPSLHAFITTWGKATKRNVYFNSIPNVYRSRAAPLMLSQGAPQ